MKQITNAAIISLILLIIIISNTSARLIPYSHQGDSLVTKANKITQKHTDFPSCGEEDEESCENRRMLVEAHLDYIYTQHYQP
ncbi:Phytosulfokine precursor protein (PSK) [Castilleja foliolosa]|uniref:Phytosulfokine n=1 Tax=Castilleja foliolosa TaxID=1961234 RepID=A0ABD3CEQ7_9LAMI